MFPIGVVGLASTPARDEEPDRGLVTLPAAWRATPAGDHISAQLSISKSELKESQ